MDEAVTTVPCSWIEGLSNLHLQRGQLMKVAEDGTIIPLTDAVRIDIEGYNLCQSLFCRNGCIIAPDTYLKPKHQGYLQ